MNKPIIIDGINVSECKNFSCGICKEENKIPRSIEHFTVDCAFYPNCHYKQLQQLKAENKILQEKLKCTLKNNANITSLRLDISDLKAENEELQKENKRFAKQLIEYENTITKYAETINTTKQTLEIYKLRKEAEELKIDNELFKIFVRNQERIMHEMSNNFGVLLGTIAKLRDKLYRIYGIAKKINMGRGNSQQFASEIMKIVKEDE